ncbi:MAG: hypothetical protein QNI98_00055 [Woeseiaceae bacterium]|nr:hypothetical protein [Woeseiaceae bacterium]
MFRLNLTILIALFVATAAWAQDTETDDEAQADSPAAEEAPAVEDEVTDEDIEELLGLDEDWSETEDDDFNPTEQVRFEQNIAFPVDI